MTTPSYAELVTAVRREGEALYAAASLGLDADVPTCEKWALNDLVRHVSKIFSYVTLVVNTRATESPQRPALPEGDPVAIFADVLDGLVAALQDTTADTPIWNWSDSSINNGWFWARRMAHESSIHRYDAQSAHGVEQPIDAELAGDGIDELFDVVAAQAYLRSGIAGPTGTVALTSTDVTDGTWALELQPHGIRRLEVLSSPDVTVTGTTSSLLLATYSRVPWSSLEVTGDAGLLGRWTEAMSF